MDVLASGGRGKRREAVWKLLIALGLVAVVLAPGFAFPLYFRVLATACFVLLALFSVRAFIAVVASFKPVQDPPEKPADVPWPRVSVLVPAYNEEAVLPRAMASMLEVDYPSENIEFVYVYEKKCTDRTEDIILGYAERDPRFKPVLRDEQGGGKAAATNHGIPHCTGDFIVSLDADHALEPGAVKRAVRWFLADAELMCVKGRCIGMNGDESYLANQIRVERDAIEKGDIYTRQVTKGFTFFGGGQAVFRATVFDELGLMDPEIMVEDIDYSIRILEAGHRLRIDPGVRTWEENPPDLNGWWAQRKRWARGWMQVTNRYLGRVFGMKNLSLFQRVDMAHTLAYVVIPVGFVLLLPLDLIHRFGLGDTSTFFADWQSYVWTSFMLAPIALASAVWIQDRRDGVRHDLRELPAFLTLWFYLVGQTVVFWSAFLEEYVLRKPSVYVKTTKSGQRKGTTA